jgi:hypothetical protein
MNKYTAVGLLAAAAEGKRVIVASPHDRAVRDAADEVYRVAPDLRWRRTNGDARVTLPSGGAILFLTPSRLRSHSADVVLVEDDLDRDRDLVGDLHEVISTSTCGEIVRY